MRTVAATPQIGNDMDSVKRALEGAWHKISPRTADDYRRELDDARADYTTADYVRNDEGWSHADPRFEYADRLRKIENEIDQRIGTDEERADARRALDRERAEARAQRAAERAEFKRTDFGPGVFRDEALIMRKSVPIPDVYEIEKRVRAKVERLAEPERDRPPSEKMREAGYTFERGSDGRAEYSHNGDLAVIDRVDGVYVAESKHYKAAVELAREKYGDTIRMSSMDPGLMRAVQEAGMSVKNFANDEQREIYERVAADLRRERGLERELPLEPPQILPLHPDVERAQDARAERDAPEHLASIVARQEPLPGGENAPQRIHDLEAAHEPRNVTRAVIEPMPPEPEHHEADIDMGHDR